MAALLQDRATREIIRGQNARRVLKLVSTPSESEGLRLSFKHPDSIDKGEMIAQCGPR